MGIVPRGWKDRLHEPGERWGAFWRSWGAASPLTCARGEPTRQLARSAWVSPLHKPRPRGAHCPALTQRAILTKPRSTPGYQHHPRINSFKHQSGGGRWVSQAFEMLIE